MWHGHWPWILFFVVSVPFAVYGELDGIVYWVVPAAVVLDLSLVEGLPHPRHSYQIIAACLTIYATTEWPGNVADVPSSTITVLLVAVSMYFVNALIVLWSWRVATVLRAYVYTIGMFVSRLLAILHLRQLKHLAGIMSIAETTTRPCVLPGNHTDGYLFAAKGYHDTCPTAVWDDVRLNSIFATQLYVLYTLTTGLRRDYIACKPYGYIPGVLAVIECVMLSAAASVQFDLIPDCHTLQWGVGILLLVAQHCTSLTSLNLR